jgi:hypothetical protein
VYELAELHKKRLRSSVADPDPDPAFHFDSDPDPAFQFDTDPDPTV